MPLDVSHHHSTQGWLAKALAGTVLGFTLALTLSGLLALITPGGFQPDSGRVQFMMWIVSPLWVLVLSICLLFRSGLHAWLWLSFLNAGAGVLLLILRSSVH